MEQQLLCIGLLFIVCVTCQPAAQVKPLLLDKYEISLFSEDRILSSVIWLEPASCLFEAWMMQTFDASVATRSTSMIQVEVQIAGNNDTYIVPDQFSIPQCKTIFGEPPPTEAYVFQVGPDIRDQSNTRVIRILPGTAYKVRYVLYTRTAILAYTNWSQPFMTRAFFLVLFSTLVQNEIIKLKSYDMPLMSCMEGNIDSLKYDLPESPRDMYVSLERRSGGMVVITVILSISMFMLLVGLAVTFATHK